MKDENQSYFPPEFELDQLTTSIQASFKEQSFCSDLKFLVEELSDDDGLPLSQIDSIKNAFDQIEIDENLVFPSMQDFMREGGRHQQTEIVLESLDNASVSIGRSIAKRLDKSLTHMVDGFKLTQLYIEGKPKPECDPLSGATAKIQKLMARCIKTNGAPTKQTVTIGKMALVNENISLEPTLLYMQALTKQSAALKQFVTDNMKAFKASGAVHVSQYQEALQSVIEGFPGLYKDSLGLVASKTVEDFTDTPDPVFNSPMVSGNSQVVFNQLKSLLTFKSDIAGGSYSNFPVMNPSSVQKFIYRLQKYVDSYVEFLKTYSNVMPALSGLVQVCLTKTKDLKDDADIPDGVSSSLSDVQAKLISSISAYIRVITKIKKLFYFCYLQLFKYASSCLDVVV